MTEFQVRLVEPMRSPGSAAIRRRPPGWLRIAAGFLIAKTIAAFGIVNRAVYGDWPGKTTGDPITQSLNLLGMGVSAVLFYYRMRNGTRFSFGEKLILFLSLSLVVTTVWSIDPATSLRRGVLYFAFIVGVIGIADALDDNEFISQLRTICLVAASTSLILLIVHPVLVNFLGDFRGIFAQKNQLGQVMSAGVLASLHGIRAYGTSGRPRAGRRQYIICWLSLPIFLVTVVLSESMTSLLASLGLCGANIIVMWYRRKGAYRLLANVATTVGVPVAIVVMVYWDSMLELLGKDPTLTGRTELWELVKLNIAERPLFGWGLGAFWTDTNPLVAAISFEIGWAPPHAHNGLLELLLEIGLFGTAIFAFILVRNTVMAVKALQTPGRELAVTALFCIGATIMTGISESVLIDPSEVFVIIFFVSGLLCERAVRVHRASRRVATGYVRGLTSARPF